MTNTAYVANYNSSNVTVINGAADMSATVSVGTNPTALAVNPITNMIYVANYANSTVSVIGGAAATVVATVTDPSAQGSMP